VKSKKRKICWQSFTTLMVIAIFISGVPGTVICKSEDGHISIEIINSECCQRLMSNISTESSELALAKTLSSNENDCGSCIDTPFSISIINSSKKTNCRDLTIFAVHTLSNSSVSFLGSGGHRSISELPVSLNPSLACLRTIILLA